MTDPLIKAHVRLTGTIRRATARLDDETGDVPGWVLITLMTAGLVAVLWTVAEDQLQAMFQRAMNSVSR